MPLPVAPKIELIEATEVGFSNFMLMKLSQSVDWQSTQRRSFRLTPVMELFLHEITDISVLREC